MLTKKQEEIYKFIILFETENLYSPTVREIGKGVGLKSSSSVHFHLKKLEENGYITMNNTPRAIKLIGFKLVKEEVMKD